MAYKELHTGRVAMPNYQLAKPLERYSRKMQPCAHVGRGLLFLFSQWLPIRSKQGMLVAFPR